MNSLQLQSSTEQGFELSLEGDEMNERTFINPFGIGEKSWLVDFASWSLSSMGIKLLIGFGVESTVI